MSAADFLNAIPPISDDVCSACNLVSHGIHCQRTTRHGQPCQCSCRARLTLATATSASEPAPRASSAGVAIGTVVQLGSAAERRPSHDPDVTTEAARRLHPASRSERPS